MAQTKKILLFLALTHCFCAHLAHGTNHTDDGKRRRTGSPDIIPLNLRPELTPTNKILSFYHFISQLTPENLSNFCEHFESKTDEIILSYHLNQFFRIIRDWEPGRLERYCATELGNFNIKSKTENSFTPNEWETTNQSVLAEIQGNFIADSLSSQSETSSTSTSKTKVSYVINALISHVVTNFFSSD